MLLRQEPVHRLETFRAPLAPVEDPDVLLEEGLDFGTTHEQAPELFLDRLNIAGPAGSSRAGIGCRAVGQMFHGGDDVPKFTEGGGIRPVGLLHGLDPVGKDPEVRFDG